VYWTHSLKDLRTALNLKVGHQQSLILQEYQTISSLLALVFGGKSSQPKPLQSFDEAAAAFGAVFGNR
jgi:hypothetical protein